MHRFGLPSTFSIVMLTLVGLFSPTCSPPATNNTTPLDQGGSVGTGGDGGGDTGGTSDTGGDTNTGGTSDSGGTSGTGGTGGATSTGGRGGTGGAGAGGTGGIKGTGGTGVCGMKVSLRTVIATTMARCNAVGIGNGPCPYGLVDTHNRCYAYNNTCPGKDGIQSGVLWVATDEAQPKFVKTLKFWVEERIYGVPLYLSHIDARDPGGTLKLRPRWNATLAPPRFTNGATPPLASPAVTDAITSGTPNAHIAHTDVPWNCTDYSKQPVPNGKYLLCMEFSEWNSTVYWEGGPIPDPDGNDPTRWDCIKFSVPFTAGTMAVPDTTYFKSRSVTFTR